MPTRSRPSRSRLIVPRYSAARIDQLSHALCETVVAKPGVSVPYDVELYRRVQDCRPATGSGFCDSATAARRSSKRNLIPPACLGNEAYLLRVGGYRRDNQLGPDEAALTLRRAGIRYADSLGNGLFEHLALCRKHGIVPVFEAPAMQMAFPFLDEEFPVFRQRYREHVREMLIWVQRAEAIYGRPIARREGQPWILWCPLSPLALFLESVRRSPRSTAQTLLHVSGSPSLLASPKRVEDRLRQLKAVAFIRRQHMRVLKTMSQVLREAIPGAVILGNMHVLPPVDYEGMHDVFDHPGIAVRPGYIQDACLREPYVAYSARLCADLSGRLPIMSLRANITAAGTNFIAGENAIRRWFDACIQQGIAGFYLWPIDYPISISPYRGGMSANPNRTVRGRERWNALLAAMETVSRCRRFVPPRAEVAILVPYDVMEPSDWLRVFGTFTEMNFARVRCELVCGRVAERDVGTLSRFKAIAVPALPFLSDRLAHNLMSYVQRGGTLLVPDEEIGTWDTHGRRRDILFGVRRGSESAPDVRIEPRGLGRLFIMRAPAVGRSLATQDCRSSIRQTSGSWRKVARALNLTEQSWVFDLTGDDLAAASGTIEPRTPPPDASVTLRHYLYEHSSDWIFPFIQAHDESPRQSAERSVK